MAASAGPAALGKLLAGVLRPMDIFGRSRHVLVAHNGHDLGRASASHGLKPRAEGVQDSKGLWRDVNEFRDGGELDLFDGDRRADNRLVVPFDLDRRR